MQAGLRSSLTSKLFVMHSTPMLNLRPLSRRLVRILRRCLAVIRYARALKPSVKPSIYGPGTLKHLYRRAQMVLRSGDELRWAAVL